MFMQNCKAFFSRISDLSKTPGNKAPILRLCLVAIICIVGLVLTILALPYAKEGIDNFLTAILTGVMTTIVVAAIVWGFAKWAVFAFPKSLQIANRIWNAFIPWGLLGLLLKAMVWIWILFMPVTLFGLLMFPLYLVVGALSLIGSEVLSALILSVLCVGSLAFMILLDVSHLQRQDWKQVLHTTWTHVCTVIRKPAAS